jgi:demethylmenaquinone methyltransferase/2-methoxy-6-polyprenyl-1,4-benzoquinol methylase
VRDVDRDLVDEQVRYYRARAPEYDRWFGRVGRYDLGPEENARWFNEVETVRSALAALGPVDDALELACGTGLWTAQLLPICSSITAVDAAPEMLAINRETVASARVEYREADLFDWEPDRRYDLVFFGFWLTHIPREMFRPFWEKVAQALEPGGRVFLVDNLRTPIRLDHSQEDRVTGTMVRQLEDGRSFRIVKVFYSPDELTRLLEPLGWSCRLKSAGRYLVYGSLTRVS